MYNWFSWRFVVCSFCIHLWIWFLLKFDISNMKNMWKVFRCTNVIWNLKKIMYFIFYKILLIHNLQFDVDTIYMKSQCQFNNIFQRNAAEILHTSLKIFFILLCALPLSNEWRYFDNKFRALLKNWINQLFPAK